MFDFTTLFGGQNDNPLLNAKEVTHILDSLATSEPIQALDEISHWLSFLATSDDFKLKLRANLSTRFNQVAQLHARKLLMEYVQKSRMNKSREETIWNACSEFFLAAYDAHTRCVSDYVSHGRGGINAEEIAMTAVRGMRAIGMLTHWAHLRYRQPLPASIWDKVYALFSIAEQRKFCRMPVVLNPQTPVQTSLLMEMVKILMMEVSSPEQLTKPQIELARQVIEEFASCFVWEQIPAGETIFYIDFSLRKPPVRLTHMAKPHFMTRCFGPGSSVPALVNAVKQLEIGAVPKDLDIRRYPDFKRQDLLEVLLHLSQYWSKLTPQEDRSHYDKRQFARNKFFSHFEVVHGLDPIHKKILEWQHSPAGLPEEEIIDKLISGELRYDLPTNKIRPVFEVVPEVGLPAEIPVVAESWVAENVSETGYGLSIPELKQDWVQETVLLGLKTERSKWSLGVIQRMEMGSKADAHVGIRLLARAPVAASLSPIDTNLTVWETAGETFSLHHTSALLLRADPPLMNEDCLIVPAGSCDLHKTYELATNQGKQLVRLDFFRESFHKTELVTFTVVNQGHKR